eukprot:3800-Heterococcus_DN1.PRE.3
MACDMYFQAVELRYYPRCDNYMLCRMHDVYVCCEFSRHTVVADHIRLIYTIAPTIEKITALCKYLEVTSYLSFRDDLLPVSLTFTFIDCCCMRGACLLRFAVAAAAAAAPAVAGIVLVPTAAPTAADVSL